jgi:hypothetical protein
MEMESKGSSCDVFHSSDLVGEMKAREGDRGVVRVVRVNLGVGQL